MFTSLYLQGMSRHLSIRKYHAFYRINCVFKGTGTVQIKKAISHKTIGANILLNRNLLNLRYQGCHPGLKDRCLFSVKGIDTLVLRCHFHTTGQRTALPPLLWAVLSPLYKIAAALAGRNIRNRLKEQPVHLRKKYHRMIMIAFAAGLSTLGGIALYYYESHQQEAPISGRKRFITLDKEQCRKIANYELESFEENFKDKTLPPTHPYYQIVVDTGLSLVRANKDIPGMTDQQWVVHVVQSPEKNAFVLPNGHIFVYTGMIEFCENRDQLAVIMGHEMAHAVLLHAAEQLSYSQFSDKIIIGLMTALWTFMPHDGIAIVFQWYCNKLKQLHLDMPYSRSLEKEADYVGLQLAAKACFDVREGAALWERMYVIEAQAGTEKTPEWLSTHPSHQNRVKNMNELIPKNLELRMTCKCPRLPEVDPRHRIQPLRNSTHNFMIAKASKANLQRVEKVAAS